MMTGLFLGGTGPKRQQPHARQRGASAVPGEGPGEHGNAHYIKPPENCGLRGHPSPPPSMCSAASQALARLPWFERQLQHFLTVTPLVPQFPHL